MITDTSWEEHQALKRSERRLAFLQRLQELTRGIDAAEDIDEIMLGMSRDICGLFGCDRLTLYAATPCRTAIRSRIKTGMDTFKDFELPITTTSIAGYVALHKRSFNIKNVYDAEELRSYSRELCFLDRVDKRTGYRSREMVAAPIVNPRNGELLGVLQLINNRLGGPFPELIEEGARELCKTLAAVFERLMQDAVTVTTRFDPLVVLGTLAAPELELAKRSARRKQLDLDDVLLDEFQVPTAALGAAYAHFFGVPYEPFRADRGRPAVLQNVKREFAEHHGWVVIEEDAASLVVAALEPDRLRATRAVENLFPERTIALRVMTRREFKQTVEQLYGVPFASTATLATEHALVERVQRIVGAALASGAPDLRARVQADQAQLVRNAGADTETRQITIAITIDLPDLP